MQINSATSFTPQSSGNVPVENKNQVAEQRDRLRVQQTQQSNEQETNSAVQRFDVDEKTLALVEQAQQNSTLSSQTNGRANQSYNQTNQPSNQAAYDNPSQQNKSAVAAYSTVENITQRESLQQVFGIDLLV
jgi:hypothetical protein